MLGARKAQRPVLEAQLRQREADLTAAKENLRLRIEETYTDPARYALIDGQLMWNRSFGRPRNDIVLPAGWHVTTSSIPATVTLTEDDRVRLSYVNPRPDSIDVFVKARRGHVVVPFGPRPTHVTEASSQPHRHRV